MAVNNFKSRVWLAITIRGKSICLAALRGPTCNNPGRWNLIGGGIDDGETPQQAAVREAYEETGLVIDPKDLKPCFQNLHKGRLVFWYTVPLKKIDLQKLHFTRETVDFEFADKSWIGKDKIHYSLQAYLGWRVLEEAIPNGKNLHLAN